MIDSVKESFGKKEATAPKAVQKTPPSQQAAPVMTPSTVARVGNWSISKDEFEERLTALKEIVPDYDTNDVEARKLVLDELIRQQLIVIDAERTGLANQKDIVTAVDEFRRTLLVREAARKITENVSVDENEARDFYTENQDQIVNPFRYRVSEIVVDSEVKANEIYVDLLKGGDFSAAAKQFSTSASADDGGDLGFLEEDPFPAMVEMVLSLGEGETSKVFEGPDGFYIVKLTEKTGGEKVPFSEVKDDIIQNRTLFKQQQAILEYIENLKGKIQVEVNESLIN